MKETIPSAEQPAEKKKGIPLTLTPEQFFALNDFLFDADAIKTVTGDQSLDIEALSLCLQQAKQYEGYQLNLTGEASHALNLITENVIKLKAGGTLPKGLQENWRIFLDINTALNMAQPPIDRFRKDSYA